MNLTNDLWTTFFNFFPEQIATAFQTFVGLIKGEMRTQTTHTGAGAVPITHDLVEAESGAAPEAWTLADGVDGQELYIFFHTHGGGNATLTPANLSNAATATFTGNFQTLHLLFLDGNWHVLSFDGCTIA